MKKTIKVVLIALTILSVSCKKFLEISPPRDAATFSQIFDNDEIATSTLTGIYSKMATSGAFSGSETSIAVLGGLSGDELKSYNLSLEAFYKNEIPTNSAEINTVWSNAYSYIYASNAILNGLGVSKAVTEKTTQQLQGEAKFVRAFCYFYLVNLFGEIPLHLTTDYRINETASKSSTNKIYSQIITDLTDAENLLSPNYVTTERIRPNKWVAKTLLSRVYLYLGEFELAAKKATEVIDQKSLFSLVDDLDKVFLKNSTEAIWQLMPTAGNNTQEGALFILTTTPTTISLSPNLIPLFEPSDNRRTKWIQEFTNSTGKYYYPYKYKIRTTINGIISEYSMVMRLAELYLIRAESRSRLGQSQLALDDINLIRKRAGLAVPLVGLSPDQCLSEVEKQRRFELFTEWGHRWLDLKRTHRAEELLSVLKGNTWKNTDVLYPIPDSETTRNLNINQNLGY